MRFKNGNLFTQDIPHLCATGRDNASFDFCRPFVAAPSAHMGRASRSVVEQYSVDWKSHGSVNRGLGGSHSGN